MQYLIPTHQCSLMAIMLLSCAQSAVLVWDPSVYNATLEEWYNKPDWPFFEQFFSKRLMKPEDPLYLLHPGNLPTFKLTRRIIDDELSQTRARDTRHVTRDLCSFAPSP